ncbi:MAG: D-alanyl-D-alanine carboxypeptidase/D-alanyl-D-alanine-endopeptidase [Bacteroidales bacterium]|nr:D-alanyl-D-alanine carboxypeptidase/D-alanyl-D-alanine-endopeptidase [Bacteroidales bacterium]MCF8405943.1 D-alanyl-D-alanine carboxypeptidase/D-alanyl-D-alanine-endopeptidase [Bacteroidales bacterium]
MKKILFIFILFSTFTNGFSQFRKLENRNHNLNKELDEIIHDNDFKNAGFAFLAIDLNSGETIAGYNSDMALKPASTQKLITTATALELYGPDYKFETKLEYTGTIDTVNHILYGDIIIMGGGDPTLGSKYFDTTKNKQFLSQWVNGIKSLGIDSVAGAVIADAGYYSLDIVPPTWSWQNMGNYFGAGACGLSIYDNYYSIFLNSGSTVGDTTIISELMPEIPGLVFENAVIADSISYDNAYIFGAPYSFHRSLRGEIPLNKSDFVIKGSIPDPACLAAMELEKALVEIGVGLKNKATTFRILKQNGEYPDANRKEILTIYSPQLSLIITETNVHSINLYAEHFLNHSGIKLGSNPDTKSSAEAVQEFWKEKGMDIQGMELNDGSGLSTYNQFTPRQMVFLLNYMKNESRYFDAFFHSMAVAGETGTIENMFKASVAEGKIRAKSGTISRVKAYSGYVESLSGREIAFSMVVNNFSCSSGTARDKLERLMISLAEFNK